MDVASVVRHVMVDIETLGSRPGSIVTSIGGVRFGDEGLGPPFYRTVNVFDALMAGLTIDSETVTWWRTQPKESRAAITAKAAERTLGEALHEFAAFLLEPPDPRVWAKGQAAGLERPWRYHATRDVRTVLSMAPPDLTLPQGRVIAHHALHDAMHQAEQVRAVYRALGLKLDAGRE